MASYFNLEGFLFWLLIGEFFAMLLKAMFHRVLRWIRHVQYMTKLAGGSLLVDIEADYWLKKIKDPMYRPIWRWYYGSLWNKAHPSGTSVQKRKKRTLIKFAATVSAILLICIGLVATFGVPNILPPSVPVTTQLEVYGQANLSLVSQSSVGLGGVYDLNGTARPDGNYSGGWAGLGLGLVRTDRSNSDATVFLNVTSGMFKNATTNATMTYLYRVTYLIFDPMGQQVTQYDVFNSGGDTQFGYLFTVPAHGMVQFNVFLFFRAFNSTVYGRYVTMQPAFSDIDSIIGINGGYSYPVVNPCVVLPTMSNDMIVVSARC